MERYSEYKDSGVKWLGEIPSHWEVMPIKYISEVSSGATPKTSVQGYWDGNITWVTPADFKTETKFVLKGNRNITTLGVKSCSTVILPKGSLVFSKRAPIGQVSILKIPLCTNQGCFGIIPNESMNNSFLYYSLAIHAQSFNTLGSGTTFRELSFSTFSSFKISVPPKEEQDAIVRYLDAATSKIDKAIAMQQKMIDLLNERKQIIIQNAVTKGLDENVEMKDSGVEWIGMIPKHWEIKRLKYVMHSYGRIGFRGYGTDDIVDEGQGAITLSPSNIQDSSMDYSKKTYLSWSKYYESPEIMIKNGDVLMVKTGSSYGKCAVVKGLPMECTINPQLVVFKEHKELPEFLAYSFQTTYAKCFINTSVIGGTIPTISQEKINNYIFPFPPKTEQQAIVAYLDKQMQRFDSAISNCQRQISLLQERKQIIINEVVTGKVKVS
ncbi:restriction endonuclease subunit S [Segatella copri]|uniref:restriction endonuclease subunit S n=1 Tax=Segatella copri TaxID=165179 RepID=UPI00294ABBAD|nr:restriction endonuclease subunit S [Segatella copri]WOG05533.1 restriction endonuclease subunit S [Segatella copri]